MSLSTDFFVLVRLFLKLSSKRKGIINRLHHCHKTHNGTVFLSVNTIAADVGCTDECIKDFNRYNERLGGIFFERKARYNESGRQTSNLYVLSKPLLQALEWLRIYGWLHADKKKHKRIFSTMEKQQKAAPPPPQKAAPYIRDSYDKRLRFEEPPKIHPRIGKIQEISLEEKVHFSKYPENIIMVMMEDVWNYHQAGNKIDNLPRFMQFRVNRAIKKYGNRRIQ